MNHKLRDEDDEGSQADLIPQTTKGNAARTTNPDK